MNTSAPTDLQSDAVSRDSVLPFQIEAAPLRGRLVRLDDTIHTILTQHAYPLPICILLAKTTALAAALGTALKFNGVFTIQTTTDGPVRMLVVDVTSDGAVRAFAQFDAQAVAEGKEGTLLGKGNLVFTVDQTLSDERYQGIVQITGDDLTEAFKLYFKQSEQIPTGLMAAAQQDEAGHWHAGCLLLQKMPSEGGIETTPLQDTSVEDGWLRAMALMQTCTAEELTDPSLLAADLLYRLFHEDGVRTYERKPLSHACRCSQDKIAGVLEGLPKDEITAMVQDDGKITVTCQFCNRAYHFDQALKASD